MSDTEIYDCGCGIYCLVGNCKTREAGGCYCCCSEGTQKWLWDQATDKEREEGFIYRAPPSEKLSETIPNEYCIMSDEKPELIPLNDKWIDKLRPNLREKD